MSICIKRTACIKSGDEYPTCEYLQDSGEDITKQPHYTQFKIQPLKFSGENKLGFLEGNIIKYVCRYNLKNGVGDLKKARHYLEKLIEREEHGTISL